MNKLFDKEISLDKGNHEYRLSSQPDIEFTSVTTFVDQFFEGFDSEKIAANLVNNVPKYFDHTVESLIAEWDAARQHGTDVHQEIEDWINDSVEPKEPKAIAGKNWLNSYRMKTDMDILSEVIVYSKELRIAGTVDILAKDRVTGKYELIDWKTSKRIDTVSFKGKVGTSPVTRNVQDCNFNHYALQLSLYRYLLEEYYGIIVNKLLIAQLQDERAHGYVAPYMRDHIIEMLKNK
ncbi:MAG TPA: hypothetical protein EYO45_04225 [Candidatus Marinimicrobia bacterium]|nr:hypothetical protein [Candidatus Neomarinimicrobiota bacterium]